MTEPANTPQSGSAKKQTLPRWRVTREGWGILGLTCWLYIATYLSHASLMLLIACIWTGALLCGFLQTIQALRKLECETSVPDRTVAGRNLQVRLTLRSLRSQLSVRGILAQFVVPKSAETKPLAGFFPLVKPKESVDQTLELTFEKRGKYLIEGPKLLTRFPFGLIESQKDTREKRPLVVYPKMGFIRSQFFQTHYETHLYQEGKRLSFSVAGSDYHGLRDYRDGDHHRTIHWPTSARRGELMVKEYEARHNRDVAIMLDPWLPEEPGNYQSELLELAISFTATLVAELSRKESLRLVLAIPSNPMVLLQGQTSERLLHSFLEQLAILEGTHEPNWIQLYQEIPMSWTSTMKFTLVSPRSIAEQAAQWIDQPETAKKWARVRKNIVQIDVGKQEMRDFFNLTKAS